MHSKKVGSLSLITIYNTTARSLKSNPLIFLPFILFATFEFITLAILYYAPRAPLRLVFGPLIRTFWAEKFLHYPLNFLLLPKLVSLSRMPLAVIFGSLLTAVAIAIIYDTYNKKPIRLGPCFKLAFKRYVNLFAVVFAFTASYYLITKIITLSLTRYFLTGKSRLLFFGIGAWFGPILATINFIFALLIQSLFVYALPILIIENEKLVRAVIKSFLTFKKLFLKTIVLVGLPMLLFIPLILLQYNTPFLIDNVFPESVLLLLCLGIILNSLLIDPLVTASVTFLYLLSKEKEG